jgi:PleD family two-component response regulator
MGNSNSKAAKRIVVVDDNEDICAFMSAALKNAGYVVETIAATHHLRARQDLDTRSERPRSSLLPVLYEDGAQRKARRPPGNVPAERKNGLIR